MSIVVSAVFAFAPLAPAPTPAPAWCPVSVTKDFVTFGIAYKAILKVDRSCPMNSKNRVRKVSTLNARANYRPQKPDGSAQFGNLWAWEVGSFTGKAVPTKELWTLYTWRWQYWDGKAWQRMVVR